MLLISFLLSQVNNLQNNVTEFDNVEVHRNGHDSEEEGDEGLVETDANSADNEGLEGRELEEDDDTHELVVTTEPDMDLSLLNDEDGIDDSDLDKSNDDAETLKLLNEDDDAFESFLDEGENSNDHVIQSSSTSSGGGGTNIRDKSESQHIDQSLNDSISHDSENAIIYSNDDEEEEEDHLLDNEGDKIESEEEEIDDEMEGDD